MKVEQNRLLVSIIGLCLISFIVGTKYGYDIGSRVSEQNKDSKYICKKTNIDFKAGEYCCYQDDCYFKYPAKDLGIFAITNNIKINISGV